MLEFSFQKNSFTSDGFELTIAVNQLTSFLMNILTMKVLN